MRRIGLDELARVAPETEGRAATRVALQGQLRGETLLDPPPMAAQPGLRRLGQVDELIPVALAVSGR